MLLEFIRANRTELIRRTQEKVRSRAAPLATPAELESGVPLFLSQFTDLLAGTGAEPPAASERASTASDHGKDLLRRGFTVAQVVHDYGDICQAVTELAAVQQRQIDTDDFHLLNLCLDDAIADAVTGYSRQRDQELAGAEVERLGFLAHELRNHLATATMAFEVLRGGTVAIGGSTAAVVERSLAGMRKLVERSLAEVRLERNRPLRTRILLAEFIEEMEVAALLDARKREIELAVAPPPYGISIEADRQLLASAVSNLLQNAFKFTPPRGHVELRARPSENRVLIEVEDECGGLPPGKAEELFRPFERRGADLSGLGLGLTISKKSVHVNGGEIRVKNLPGKGCVFIVDMPLAA